MERIEIGANFAPMRDGVSNTICNSFRVGCDIASAAHGRMRSDAVENIMIACLVHIKLRSDSEKRLKINCHLKNRNSNFEPRIACPKLRATMWTETTNKKQKM